MLEFKTLTIDDKELFESYTKHKYDNSEASFANIFIWREFYNTLYAVVGDFLVIYNSSAIGEKFCYVPFGDGDFIGCVDKLREHFHSKGEKLTIVSASQEQAEIIRSHYSDAVVNRNRDFEDYVYLTENLITLSGRKLRSKRNHLNNFHDRYEYKYRELTKADFDECIELSRNSILKTRTEDDVSYIYEMASIKSAFEQFDRLELCGGVIEIDGKIVAFTVGELLNDENALIHIEKADTDYDGIYAAINNEFAKNRWKDITYINREEDMGLEGLRTAKQSYRPHHMVEKYLCVI